MGISTFEVNKTAYVNMLKTKDHEIVSASLEHYFYDRSWRLDVVRVDRVDGQNRAFYKLENNDFVEVIWK